MAQQRGRDPPPGEQVGGWETLGDMGNGSIDALLSPSFLPYYQFLLRILRMDPVGIGCPCGHRPHLNLKCLRQKPVPIRMARAKLRGPGRNLCHASLSRPSVGWLLWKKDFPAMLLTSKCARLCFLPEAIGTLEKCTFRPPS